MKAITPLKKGDTVLIITPAKAIPADVLKIAIAEYESWGLKVEVGANALGAHHYFSGKDVERANDLQWALDHPTGRAIISARGGYGSVRVVDEVDYSRFLECPKWFVGFSDITVFHNKFHGTFNLQSMHAVAPVYFDRLKSSDETITSLRKALFGEPISTTVDYYKCNRIGNATGVLVGGNLAIMASLIGTSLDIDTAGKILFLEDVSEFAYRFDRMMWSLKKSGKLENLAGLVIGSLTDMKLCDETFGCTVEELVRDVVLEYDFPVMFNYPAGHQLDNRAFILGAEYTMSVDAEKSVLNQITDGRA